MASLVIDNFTEGTYNASLISGNNLNYQSGSTGSIVGGKRSTYLAITSDFNQTPGATLDIGRGRLILDTGVRVYHRLEVGYGYDETLLWRYFPLRLNLRPDLSPYTRFRINFNFSDNIQGDNFNIQVGTAPGSLDGLPGGGISQAGVSTLPVGTSPFSFELPFDSFVGVGGPVAGAAADFHSIDTILLIFQTGSPGGASDFAIHSIECV